MRAYYYSNPTKERISQEEIAKRRAAAAEAQQRKSDSELLKKQYAAEQERQLLKQAKSYLKAEAKHAWGGPAPEDEVRKRIELCLQCPGRVEELDGKTDTGGIGFCTKCGCPANKRSQLSVKLTLAGVPCPLGKFNVVEGTGGTIASAVEAAKGVVSSVLGRLVKQPKTDHQQDQR